MEISRPDRDRKAERGKSRKIEPIRTERRRGVSGALKIFRAEGKRDGRKERAGISENKKAICVDHPHRTVSTPRPGDVRRLRFRCGRNASRFIPVVSAASIIGEKTEKKVIPRRQLMRVERCLGVDFLRILLRLLPLRRSGIIRVFPGQAPFPLKKYSTLAYYNCHVLIARTRFRDYRRMYIYIYMYLGI